MATVIKLPNAGDTLTTRVIKCEVVESQKTKQEQVKFTTSDGDLYIGRETADRQLGRCGFCDPDDVTNIFYADVDGCLLTFYRSENKTSGLKPYWNIKRADADEPVRGRAEKPLAPPAPPPAPAMTEDGTARRSAIELAYKRAWAVAVAVQGKLATADSLQAGAATVFIAYQNNHLLGLFHPAEPIKEFAKEPAKEPAKPAPTKAPVAKPAPVPPPADEDEPDFDGDDAAIEPQDDLPF